MKKSIVICFLTVFILLSAIGEAAAANWVYVGKLQLASGKKRTDYIDGETVTINKVNATITFWVLSETTDPERPSQISAWKKTKYASKLDGTYATQKLEWHGYTKVDGKVIELSSTKPDSQTIYPEEFSLLAEAIEIAEQYAKEQ